MYNFTEFTCCLNQKDPLAAPTDSRFRQDQRSMEDGDFSKANYLKTLLEQKQRTRRAVAAEKATEKTTPSYCDEYIEPVWFEVDLNTKFQAPTTLYKYKGGYWEHKLKSDWSMCPDIFSVSENFQNDA